MNTNNPLVSICCLGYNHAKFINDNINAIWKSNYENIEIIVVDDGSSDNSAEVLQNLAQQSPCPMYVILQKNTGNVGHNFNVAINKAKGTFISFISLDDILKEDAISKCVNILRGDPNIAFVASSSIESFGDNLVPPLKLSTINNPSIEDLLELEFSEFGAFYIQGAFFRKEIIDAVNGFDEDMVGDDIVLRTKIFNYIKNNPHLHFRVVPEPLALYRQHESNVHLNSTRQMKIVTEYLEKYWPSRKNPKLLTAWCLHTLNSIPNEKWADLFRMNKRTLSLTTEPKVIKFFIKKKAFKDKVLIKIPLVRLFERTFFMNRSKALYLKIFGAEIKLFCQSIK